MLYNRDAGNYFNPAYQEMPAPEMCDMDDQKMCPRCGRPQNMCGCRMNPIVERPIEKCCQREFVHVIPHICPVNTKIINHHIYQHVYDTCHTCSEENVITNIDPGCCHY